MALLLFQIQVVTREVVELVERVDREVPVVLQHRREARVRDALDGLCNPSLGLGLTLLGPGSTSQRVMRVLLDQVDDI